MILGLVSNCWRDQLQANTPLENLIAEAARRGFSAVELRQSCLGEFETGAQHIPNAATLARLPSQFAHIQFNVAMALPFLSPEVNPAGSVFQAGLSAALGVSGQFTPRLRLVDLATHIAESDMPDIDAAASALAALADVATESGVELSVENSIQPWNRFRRIVNRGLSQCRKERRFRLCYDPANLLLQPDLLSPGEVTRSLNVHELSMVHFKQRLQGKFLDSVCDGDIDWSEQLGALAQIGFCGPALFEIESSSNVWQRLEASRRYLQTHIKSSVGDK